MFRKSVILLFAIIAVFTVTAVEIVKSAIDGYEFSAYNVEVKNLNEGAFELTIKPTPDNWPMVHITPPRIPSGANIAEITVQQLYPTGITPRRTHLVFGPNGIAEQILLRPELADNKPHCFRVSLKAGMVPTQISINAHAPEDKIILKISGIGFVNDSRLAAPMKKQPDPLPPVMFKGKPFFPLGSFDMMSSGSSKRYEIDPGFLASGGNIGIIGELGMPGHKHYEKHRQPVLFAELERTLSNPDFGNIALIVGLDSALLMDEDESGFRSPLTGEKLEQRKKILREDLRKLTKYPNILGFYIDEPENFVWPYYKKHFADEWERDKDRSLSRKMVEWLGWAVEVIREEMPQARIMPTIAWWTTYDSVGELYDVNLPNDYSAEFSPEKLHQTNYDAGKAVAAARKLKGGRTVVYMPGMFDILPGSGARPATLHNQRYACFAPLTRGAMGVFGWRLARCSESYRGNIVYPVMNEVKQLIPWFLGEWHDELVTSSHDGTTVDYLKKYAERVRLVENEEDGAILQVLDMVPDVSYCLRRNPADGSWLLLAVNNRTETVNVTFHLKIDSLPAVATDALDHHLVRLKNGGFTDQFEPFDVHAYIIKPNKQAKK